MRTELVAAAEADRVIVRRLLALNAYDFSELDGRDVGPHGEYGCRYLDHDWTEPDRHPFLIKVDGHLAGLVLIRSGEAHGFGEFFVLRKYRRAGVGRVAALEAFKRFPGEWLVHEVPRNDIAVAFWRTVIPADFEETVDASGTSQRFTLRSAPNTRSTTRRPRTIRSHRSARVVSGSSQRLGYWPLLA